MKKTLIIIAVVVIAGGALYLYQRSAKQAKAPAEQAPLVQDSSSQPANNQDTVATNTQPAQQTQPAATSSAPQAAKKPAETKPSTGTFSSGEEGMAPDIQVWEVAYDGNSFAPKSLNIKLGDIVIFQNNSNASVWPASDPHPTHTNYPEFDPKKSVAAGGKFQFQFTKAGTWGYHNHFNASQTGSIKVSK